MRRVVEIGVVRNFVNTYPFDRFVVVCITVADGLQLLRLRFHKLMAMHVAVRRYPGRSRFFNRHVAVTAVNLQLTRVECVAIRNSLFRHIADIGKLRRKVIPDASDG